MKVVVFLGPSLPWDEARRILPRAKYCPPAGRGDLAAVADEDFNAIGLIDGVFYQRPAVAPREILFALERGVLVVGGSSMGALRAAELHSYGMVGVGRIYEWYREGIINSDDEVALVFHPDSYRALSEPLVNVRATLEALTERGILDSNEREVLIAATKEIPFQLRNHMRIVQVAMQKGLDKQRSRMILRALGKWRVDQKKLDAQEVLKELRSLEPERQEG